MVWALLRRVLLPKNWPVWYAGGAITLIILAVVDSSYFWPYPPPANETILYPLLFFRHTLSHYLLALICPLSLLSVIGALLTSGERNWPLASLVVVANLILFGCGFYAAIVQSTGLQHLDGVTFEGYFYHLIYRDWGRDGGDVYSMDFVVYKCDVNNITCSTITEIPDTAFRMTSGRYRTGHFVIDPTDNILYVELTDGRTTERHRATG
jgi:hypothetical protein